MKSLYQTASLGLVLALTSVAIAQEGRTAPTDVPRNHWAFEAVDHLFRAGILRGYPDGTFRGNRPVTRYEMAGMLSQVNQDIRQRLQQLTERAERLERAQQDPGEIDLAPLWNAVLELQREVRLLRARQSELAQLQAQYQQIGENLQRLREEIASLRGRFGG
jgi:hypothetical protein